MTKTGRPPSPVKMVRRAISIPEWILTALKEHRGSKYDYISGNNGILTDMLRVGLYLMDAGEYDRWLELAKDVIRLNNLEKQAEDDTADEKLCDKPN